MKTLISAALLAISLPTFAGTQVCTYDLKKEGTSVNWTAYKTPKKAGVKGKLTDFNIKTDAAKKHGSVDQLLSTATFTVNTASVDTGDKARDAKIVKFFFQKAQISGKVLSAANGKVEVEFTMNGVKKTVPMTSKFDDKAGILTLNGTVDVLDFGMKGHLASLTKACSALHEGVTWPDVNVELVAAVAQSCK